MFLEQRECCPGCSWASSYDQGYYFTVQSTHFLPSKATTALHIPRTSYLLTASNWAPPRGVGKCLHLAFRAGMGSSSCWVGLYGTPVRQRQSHVGRRIIRSRSPPRSPSLGLCSTKADSPSTGRAAVRAALHEAHAAPALRSPNVLIYGVLSADMGK